MSFNSEEEEREREREREGGMEGGCVLGREREREHQVTRRGSSVHRLWGTSATRRLYSAKIMDGTKPAMESNAEETQDEGQESKGTSAPPLTAARLCVFPPPPRLETRCASLGGLTYLQWLLVCARHNSGAFFFSPSSLCGPSPIRGWFRGKKKKSNNDLSAADDRD